MNQIQIVQTLVEDNQENFKTQYKRKLSYCFNALKGIIFGIRMSDEHKSRIIEIIEKKCEKHKRDDFRYYQAYYSQETGDIRKYEIQLS